MKRGGITYEPPQIEAGAVEMLEALARALGWPNAETLLLPAGANGCVEEVVEHSHRLHILVDGRGKFRVDVARCGREAEGPVRRVLDIGDLETARVIAQGIVAELTVPQLDLFT